jgi:spore coat protein U-like protein
MSRLPGAILLMLLALASAAAPRAAAAVSCGIAVTTLNFGSNLNLTSGAAVDSTATATVTCSGGADYTSYIFCVLVSDGSYASGSQRYMANGSARLPYNLYTNATYSALLGSGDYQTYISTDGSGNASGTLTIYGQIPAGQQSAAGGSYSDALSGSANQELQYALNNGASGNTSCPLTGSGVKKSQFSFFAIASVAANCTVQSGSLAFPAASILAADIDTSGTLSVQCGSSTPYSVGLDAGSHANGTQRRMYSAATGAYVSYNLYTDSGYSSAWTTTTSATSCSNGSRNMLSRNRKRILPVHSDLRPRPAADLPRRRKLF